MDLPLFAMSGKEKRSPKKSEGKLKSEAKIEYRFCKGKRTDKKGKVKSCGTHMCASDIDPHSVCSKCRGQSCDRSLCNECEKWSEEQINLYRNRSNRRKSKKLKLLMESNSQEISHEDSASNVQSNLSNAPSSLSRVSLRSMDIFRDTLNSFQKVLGKDFSEKDRQKLTENWLSTQKLDENKRIDSPDINQMPVLIPLTSGLEMSTTPTPSHNTFTTSVSTVESGTTVTSTIKSVLPPPGFPRTATVTTTVTSTQDTLPQQTEHAASQGDMLVEQEKHAPPNKQNVDPLHPEPSTKASQHAGTQHTSQQPSDADQHADTLSTQQHKTSKQDTRPTEHRRKEKHAGSHHSSRSKSSHRHHHSSSSSGHSKRPHATPGEDTASYRVITGSENLRLGLGHHYKSKSSMCTSATKTTDSLHTMMSTGIPSQGQASDILNALSVLLNPLINKEQKAQEEAIPPKTPASSHVNTDFLQPLPVAPTKKMSAKATATITAPISTQSSTTSDMAIDRDPLDLSNKNTVITVDAPQTSSAQTIEPISFEGRVYLPRETGNGTWEYLVSNPVLPSPTPSSTAPSTTSEQPEEGPFREMLGWLHTAYKDTKPSEEELSRVPKVPMNMVQLENYQEQQKSDFRIPRSIFHNIQDEVYCNSVKGQKEGKADRPLPRGSFIQPGRFSKVYEWRDERAATEPMSTPQQWFKLTGRLPSAAKPPINISDRDFSLLETLTRRIMCVSSFNDWFLGLIQKTLLEPNPSIHKLQQILESLAKSNSQIAHDSSLAVANMTLKRRDVEMSYLPSTISEEQKTLLRSSTFRGPHLFNPETVNKVDREVKEITERQASLKWLSLKESSNYNFGSHKTTASASRGKRNNSIDRREDSKRKKQQGASTPTSHKHSSPQRHHSTSSDYKKPFSHATSKRGARGGRGRGRR